MTTRTLAAILALLVIATAVGVATVSAAQTDVVIESVETSTDQPAPGERFTLTVTLSNLQSSSGPVDVTSLYVRKTGLTTEYARVEDAGTISPGRTLSIPVTMTIGELGGKRLTVHAVFEDEDDDNTRVTYPLFVDVQEPDEALISATELDMVAGEERTLNVSVANGDHSALSNVRLELTGDASIENPERVTASLPAGTERTYPYQVAFAQPGEHDLEGSLTYKTSDGYTRTVSRNLTVSVDPAIIDPELTAQIRVENGVPVINATLTEYGNVELRDAQVRVLVDGTPVARSLVPDVPAKGAQTVSLDGGNLPAGELVVEAAYTAAGEQRTTRVSIDYSPAPTSRLVLTGVEVTRDGGVLTLSGDAANVGSADARSVVISVVPADGVVPVSPKKEYFVGAVDASEFATFEVTANASASVDTIPVRIEYTVGGERIDEIVGVDISGARDTAAGDERSGGNPLVLVGIAIGGLLVGAGGVYLWRSR